jgi:hypothetical protein
MALFCFRLVVVMEVREAQGATDKGVDTAGMELMLTAKCQELMAKGVAMVGSLSFLRYRRLLLYTTYFICYVMNLDAGFYGGFHVSYRSERHSLFPAFYFSQFKFAKSCFRLLLADEHAYRILRQQANLMMLSFSVVNFFVLTKLHANS